MTTSTNPTPTTSAPAAPGRPACRVCGAAGAARVGPPAYRRPTRVAGVPIDVSDLDLTLYRCGACGYQFVHPPIPEQRLLDCYRRAGGGHWGTGDDVADVRSYARKRDLLGRHAPGRRVVDFGCFDGGFLAYLGGEWDRAGIEPAAEAASVAASRGVRVLGPTVESVPADAHGTFDAAIVFDVMEHLNRPVETLASLGRLLRPGGVILIETGNSDSWPWRRQRNRYPYCGIVEHVGFFNRSSIGEAAGRAGLRVEHFEPSVHWKVPARKRLEYGGYNAAYRVLRGLSRVGVPMGQWARNVALGPFPRSVQPRDHFLAVLKKP